MTDENDKGSMESSQTDNIQTSGSIQVLRQSAPPKGGKAQKEIFEWVKALAIAAIACSRDSLFSICAVYRRWTFDAADLLYGRAFDCKQNHL